MRKIANTVIAIILLMSADWMTAQTGATAPVSYFEEIGVTFNFEDGSFSVLVTSQGGIASYSSIGFTSLTVTSKHTTGCSNFYRL